MHTRNSASIKWIEQGRRAEVFIPKVEIARDSSVDFNIRIRKLPLTKTPDKETFFVHTVRIDPQAACLRALSQKARRLRSLPERERITILMRMVRESFRYPFPSLIKKLEQDSPKEAQWVKEHFQGGKDDFLSEFIKRGYGECRHYAALFLILAQAANLEVILAFCLEGTLINFVRQDTQEPLFSMVPLGQVNTGHAWNEVRIRNGEWITLDPTKNLNGLNPSEREIFRMANYTHLIATTVRVRVEGIDEKRIIVTLPNSFGPGQGEVEGLLKIGLYTRIPTVFSPNGSAKKKRRHKVVPYSGPLRFTMESACEFRDDLLSSAYADTEILDLKLSQGG